MSESAVDQRSISCPSCEAGGRGKLRYHCHVCGSSGKSGIVDVNVRNAIAAVTSVSVKPSSN